MPGDAINLKCFYRGEKFTCWCFCFEVLKTTSSPLFFLTNCTVNTYVFSSKHVNPYKNIPLSWESTVLTQNIRVSEKRKWLAISNPCSCPYIPTFPLPSPSWIQKMLKCKYLTTCWETCCCYIRNLTSSQQWFTWELWTYTAGCFSMDWQHNNTMWCMSFTTEGWLDPFWSYSASIY